MVHKWPWALTSQNHWLQFWPWVPFLALSGETLARSWSPGSVTVLAMNHWLLNKFTIEESFCKKKILATPKSQVVHALSRWNHRLFTTFHAEITLEFFQGNFRFFGFEYEHRTFHDTLAHFNCTWIEAPWPFPTPRLKNLQGKKGHTYN